jgi:LAO/AO transport system kinase
MKAGVLEIANIYLVNKADLPHTELTVKDLQAMLGMANEKSKWEPPVLTSVAKENKGISDLMDAVKRHRQYLEESGELDTWVIFAAENSIRLAINDMVKNGIRGTMDNFSGELAKDVKRVARREEDPMSVARKWLAKLDLRGD